MYTIKKTGQDNNPLFETDFEKCDWEYNETHIHIDDFVDSENELDYLKFGLEYGKRIAEKLSNQFRKDKFRIVVSFSETKKVNGQIELYGSCTVRFYKIRPNAESQMYIQDLNSYKLEAVLEFEKDK